MEKSLLLIMEEDLTNRFSSFEQKTEVPVHVLQLKTSLKGNKLSTIISRLTYGRKLFSEYSQLQVKLVGVEKLFISNPEGFIAKNIISFIRRDFPRLEITSLQHGIFFLKKRRRWEKLLKTFVNILLKPLLGYFVIGDGFGEKTTDRYIVYNSLYRNYLLKNGWKETDVTISSYFLKDEKEVEKVSICPDKNAVFFLQCLNHLGVTSKEVELEIISTIINKLSKRFKTVLIKQHPYASIELPPLPENVQVIRNIPPVEEISFVVSAFSTSLLEYEKYGIPYTSIYSKKLKVNKGLYDQFLYIHNFDQAGDDDLIIIKNNTRDDLPCFFQIGEKRVENI